MKQHKHEMFELRRHAKAPSKEGYVSTRDHIGYALESAKGLLSGIPMCLNGVSEPNQIKRVHEIISDLEAVMRSPQFR